jgi:hypothetical protein
LINNKSYLWHLTLIEITNQINGQLYTAIKTILWEVIFKQKQLINWLIVQERREAEGIKVEGGEIIMEESLFKELVKEEDMEVLAGFREINEFLNIQVLAFKSIVLLKYKRVSRDLLSNRTSLSRH